MIMEEENKFPAVKFIASVYGVMAIILLIVGIIIPIYILIEGNDVMVALYVFLGAILAAISMAVICEGIYVFLSIEENTRITAKKTTAIYDKLSNK
jgi:hypothetical protein